MSAEDWRVAFEKGAILEEEYEIIMANLAQSLAMAQTETETETGEEWVCAIFQKDRIGSMISLDA